MSVSAEHEHEPSIPPAASGPSIEAAGGIEGPERQHERQHGSSWALRQRKQSDERASTCGSVTTSSVVAAATDFVTCSEKRARRSMAAVRRRSSGKKFKRSEV